MEYGLSTKSLDAIKAVFSKYGNINQVLLYGSRAKGNFSEGSDIDFVIKGSLMSSATMSNLIYDLDNLLLPYLIDICQFSEINNADLIEHINRIGHVIYNTCD